MKKQNPMNRNETIHNVSGLQRRGIVLLVTVVLLVVLATLGYTLTARVAAQRHRHRYMMDSCQARYARDSAIKYVLAMLADFNSPGAIDRPNEPDFSDLFTLDQQQYQQLIDEWFDYSTYQWGSSLGQENVNFMDVTGYLAGFVDTNDSNVAGDFQKIMDLGAAKSFIIRGPYGPPWPFLTEPVEFEIGSAVVTVDIEDENAKYPLGWMLLNQKDIEREVETGFDTFCEWMDVNDFEVDSLREQLEQLAEIKQFKLEFKPTRVITPLGPTRGATRSSAASRRRSSRRRTVENIPAEVHQTSFARLFHSSLIDTELLARPTIIAEDRTESALKYATLWPAGKVNINTAPRQVLEAAFSFGGDADEIAEEIIYRRRIKPFESIEDFSKQLMGYSGAIKNCQNYITTESTVFSIKIKSVNGLATVSAVVGVVKDNGKLKPVAIIFG